MSKNDSQTRLRSGDTLPPLTRTFDLVRGSLDEDKRTVEVTFSTENPVERWFGNEILDHSPESVDLARMNDGAPFLMDHDSRDQRGVVEWGKVDGKTGRALVRFSKTDRGEELLGEIRDGIRRKISVGYSIRELVQSIREDGVDEYRVTDWMPFEISSVSIPADNDANTREQYEQQIGEFFGARAAELSTKITVSETGQRTNQSTTKMAKPTKDQKPEDQEQRNADAPEKTDETRSGAENVSETAADKTKTRSQERDTVNTPKDSSVSPEDLQRQIDKRVAADRERCEEIRSLGQDFGLSDDDIAKAIRENATVESVKLDILERQRKDPQNAPIPTARVVESSVKGERGTAEYMLTRWSDDAVKFLQRNGHSIEAPTIRIPQPRTEQREAQDANNIFAVRSLTGAVTLADVAVLDAGIGASIIDETTATAPELGIFPVDTITGSTVELSVMTGLPTVGARNANEGTNWKRGTFESRLFQTAIIEERCGVDIQGVLNASKNPARVLAAEAGAVTRAVAEHAGVQTWYGATAQSGADAKWAPGLYAQYSADSDHELDATGSTAKTSVWILALGVNMLDHVYGNDTTLNFRDAWEEETIEDASGGKLRALTNYLSGRMATRLSNKNAAIRIKNVGTDTGKGLTDDLLSQAFELVENLGMMPTAIVCNPRSRRQLQQSRTTYSPVGLPAPLPREYEGVPIVTTKNLSNAETI